MTTETRKILHKDTQQLVDKVIENAITTPTPEVPECPSPELQITGAVYQKLGEIAGNVENLVKCKDEDRNHFSSLKEVVERHDRWINYVHWMIVTLALPVSGFLLGRNWDLIKNLL